MENCTAQDIAKIISADTAIAARVLQIVNSAFFRLARRMTNVEQAVTYLGFAAVRNLVMCAEVFAEWKAGDSTVDLERMQTHVLRVANATQAITAKTPIADDALLAALVHDIGYWILAQERPDDLREAISLARKEGIALHDAEVRIIGASHAQIGAYLLGLWGLPYSVIEAVAHHHTPTQVVQTEFDVLAALAVAHSLTEPTEADAFEGDVVEGTGVGADYLESMKAPFGWAEATRRITESLDAGADES